MIDLIARLIEMGHAYPVPGGSVYFDARSFPGYGELSGNRLAALRPGHRSGARAGQQNVEPDKRFHADWALWKTAPASRELTYSSPWGTGFPGWHTECSAMSLHYLGDTIDVHTGGIDLRSTPLTARPGPSADAEQPMMAPPAGTYPAPVLAEPALRPREIPAEAGPGYAHVTAVYPRAPLC
jgi:hypothetical protein